MDPADVDEAIAYNYDLNDRLLTEALDDKTATDADRFTRYEYGPNADFTTDPDNPFGGNNSDSVATSVARLPRWRELSNMTGLH